MTSFEIFFIETIEFFEKRNIPVFIHGSTLLRIVRDNTVEPRPDVIHDKEINLGIRAEDFTEELYHDLYNHQYFKTVNEKFSNSLIFFGKYPLLPEHSTHWDILPGFTLLAKFFKGNSKRFEYMGQDYFLQFPKYFFDDPDTWGKVAILGKTLRTPANPKEYLKYYFGEDYMTEKKEWHWGGLSKDILVDCHELEMGKEIRRGGELNGQI